MTCNVGTVGLGNLGFAMAANLMARGHRVIGYRRSSMKAFEDAGGIPAESPSAVAAEADFVITSLPTAEAVDNVFNGPKGIIAAGRSGLVVFELSTVPLKAKSAVKARMDVAGMVMLDGTISGNPHYFADRTAAVFVGGERTAFERFAPVLRDMTDKVTWLGPFGAGRVAKYVALYLVCAHTLAAAEAFELAERAGLDRRAMFAAITGSNATSAMLESRGRLMVDGDYASFSQGKEGSHQGKADSKDKEGSAAGAEKPRQRGMASRARQLERLERLAAALGGAYPMMAAMKRAYADAVAEDFGAHDIAEVFDYLMAAASPPQDFQAALKVLEELE